MEPFSITSSPPGDKQLDDDNGHQGGTLSRRRRRKWTIGFLILAVLGVTGMVVSLVTKNNDTTTTTTTNNNNNNNNNNQNEIQNNDDTPLRGSNPTTPMPPAIPTMSTPQAPPPPVYDDSDEEEPQVQRPHSTCATAAILQLEYGQELLEAEDGVENPSMDEATDAACQAIESTRAVYYKYTATSPGPVSLSLTRHDEQEPILVSVLRGDVCDDTLTCIGYNYNAMTWEAYETGETFVIMIHQVVGGLEWYLWTPETD